MADDGSYSDFLNQANQDTGAPKTQQATSKHPALHSSSVDSEHTVPASLKSIDAVYITDSDSDFEPVSLAINDKKIAKDTVKKLFGLAEDAEVEEMKTSEWDPRGQYKQVVDKVEEVTEGGVKVFRVGVERTRFLYLVLGVKEGGGRVLGVKTVGVES